MVNVETIDRDSIGDGDLTEEQRIYRENILDHYKHPRNRRGMGSPTCEHEERNPLCGDVITMRLRIEDGAVADAAFEGKGCAISQASASMLTERIKGMTVAQVEALGREQVVEMLGIPIGVVRMKCAMLSLRTTQSALHLPNQAQEGK